MSSIQIQAKIAEWGTPEQIGTTGSGENTLVLWRFPNGVEVIETNGDPVWESEDGFDSLCDAIIGRPTGVSQVTYAADDENNADVWWTEFRTRYVYFPRDSELSKACQELDKNGSVTLHDPQLIERFDAFVTGLPGWEDGPTYAPTALISTAE